MLKEKYQQDNPNNAIVTIDYTKRKDKVKFEYVDNIKSFSIVNSYFYRSCLLNVRSPFYYLFIYSLLFLTLYISQFLSIAYSMLISFLIIIFIIIPIISLIISKTRLIKIMPYLQTLGCRYYTAEFDKEDVKDNIIEIPLFDNVMLDYNATDDFSRYLTKVEIKEHDFNFKLGKKVKRNPYLFYCKFYFKSKPEEGSLKVRFS